LPLLLFPSFCFPPSRAAVIFSLCAPS
jgi:hypothetical protein